MIHLENIQRLYQLTESQQNFGYQEFEISQRETQLQTKLPQKLKDYYLKLGKNSSINYSHNRLLKPNKIEFSSDDYLVFYEENQAVVRWGIKKEDLQLDNPPVWGNYGSDEAPHWHKETNTTEDFLMLMAVYNGTLGGLTYNANSFGIINPEAVKSIQNNWSEVPEISWNKQKTYTTNFDEVISLSFDETGNCVALFIGTNHKNQFDNLLDKLNTTWSYVSYEDEDDFE